MSDGQGGQIGVGVIGCGYWGPNLIRNFQGAAGTRLVAACDVREERVRKALRGYPGATAYTSVDELLANPQIDLVAIATPVASHFSLGCAALRAGKHVLLEKPMTASVAEADELIDLAARAGRHVFVDHTFLFTPAVQRMKAMHDAGELGTLLFIDSVRINLGLFQHDVNVIWDLAPHDLAIVTHLLGGRLPLWVTAVGASHAREGMADVAYVHLDYGGGLIAHIHVNWLSPVKIRSMILGGTRRSLIWNDLDPAYKLSVYDRGVDLSTKSTDTEAGAHEIKEVLVSYRTGDMASPNLPQREALAVEVDHIVDVLAGRAEPVCGAAEARAIVVILEAAQRSLDAGGSPVALGG